MIKPGDILEIQIVLQDGTLAGIHKVTVQSEHFGTFMMPGKMFQVDLSDADNPIGVIIHEQTYPGYSLINETTDQKGTETS